MFSCIRENFLLPQFIFPKPAHLFGTPCGRTSRQITSRGCFGTFQTAKNMTAKQTIPSAGYFKEFLLGIYRCKVPFELLVVDKRPKTRMGVYILMKRRMRIYSKWIDHTPLEEIAIHEYAHHIQNTEKGSIFGRGAERAHGRIFPAYLLRFDGESNSLRTLWRFAYGRYNPATIK